jgi:hypothetical protein
MAFDYASTATQAAEVLAEFGRAATITRSVPGAYDPATGTGSTADLVQSVFAVVLPYGDNMVDGSRVLATDQQAYVSAGTAVPRAGDVMTWGADDLRIIEVKALAPAGTAVLYTMQVRS